MIDWLTVVACLSLALAVMAFGTSVAMLYKVDAPLFASIVKRWTQFRAAFGLMPRHRQPADRDEPDTSTPPVTQPVDTGEDAQDTLPSIALVQTLVERSMDAQADRATSMDQRGAALLGFSGIFVALVIRDLDQLGWLGLVGGLLALMAALSAAAVIWPNTAPALDPAYLLENYAAADTNFVQFTVASTLTDIYAATETRIEIKGRRIKYSSMLIVLAAIVLLLSRL